MFKPLHVTIFVVIIIFVILAGYQLIKDDTAVNNNPSSGQQTTADAETVNAKLIIGSETAKATIVEYFDYKCPNCGKFHQTTNKDITEGYVDKGTVKYEIRITPIIGPDSANAGRGAYCANEQGKFTTYHDLVLAYMWDNYYSSGNYSAEYDNILDTKTLAEILSSTGIDTAVFTECVDSKQHDPNLDNNLLQAADDEIRGTPGFVIADQSFVGIQPLSVYKTLLSIELK